MKTPANSANLVYLLLLIAVGITLLVLPTLHNTSYIKPTITPKTIFFIGATMGIVGLLMLYFLFEIGKGFSIRLSKSDIILILLVVYLSVNRYLIQDSRGFSIRYIELLYLALFYVALRSIKFKDHAFIWMGVLLSGVFQAVYGGLQLLAVFPSLNLNFMVTGSFFNPGPYAGFLSVIWTLALGIYLYKTELQRLWIPESGGGMETWAKRYLLDYVPLIALISIALVLPSTRSRAAWVASILGSIVILAFRYRLVQKFRSLNKLKRLTSVLFGLWFASCILVFIYSYKKDSADGRLLIWNVSADLMNDFPIFGVGFDRFGTFYMDYQADYLSRIKERSVLALADNNSYAFNEILQFTIENGIIGLVFLVLLTLVIVRAKVEPANCYLKEIGLSLLFSLLVFGLFSYPNQILPIKIIGVLALALLGCLAPKEGRFAWKPATPLIKVTMLLVLGLSVWKVINYSVRLREGFKNWKLAYNNYQNMKYSSSTLVFEKSFGIFEHQGEFLWNYGKALAMNGEHKRAITMLNRAKSFTNNSILELTLGDCYRAVKNYEQAEASYLRGFQMVPNRLYPQYLLAQLYEETGNREKAVRMAQGILEKDAKVASKAAKQIKEAMKELIEKSPVDQIEKDL